MNTSGQQTQATDAELIQRVRGSGAEGEQHVAFMVIYDRYLEDVAGVCGARLSDLGSAQDAVQDTFTAAFEDLRRPGTEVRDLRGWLRRIAERRTYRYMRGGSPGRGHRQGPDMLLLEDRQADSSADPATDVEYSVITSSLRADAERLVGLVTATLTERQQRIFQLSAGGQLRGQALGARLGVSAAQAARLTHETNKLVTDGIGALVLARAGRTYCPDLAKILDQAAWDGQNFDARLREGIVRHFDTCPICDNCTTCAVRKQELGKQLIPVLIPLIFAGELRDRIEAAIRNTAYQEPEPPRRPRPPRGANLARALWATAALVVVIALGITVVIARKPGTGTLKALATAVTSCRHLNAVSFSPSVPRHLTLPRASALPPGAALYGTRLADGAIAHIIGPSAQACDAVNGSGADGVDDLYTHPATSTAPSVAESLSVGGGVSSEEQFACPYIPQVRRIDAIGGGCSPAAGEIVSQVPTHTANVYMAAVKIPAGTADKSFPTSGHGTPAYALVADVIKTFSGQQYVWSAQEIDCKASSGSARICKAALDFFLGPSSLTQTAAGQLMTTRDRQLAVKEINNFFNFSSADAS